MKATIEFDDALYRRLKVEAARRGRTVRDLVAEGVRHVLATPEGDRDDRAATNAIEWKPAWFGMLEKQARAVPDHSMGAVRVSIARARSPEVGSSPSAAAARTGKRGR